MKETLSKKFKKPGYLNVHHIIDCTEVFIETPSDPSLKASTWSDYKHCGWLIQLRPSILDSAIELSEIG